MSQQQIWNKIAESWSNFRQKPVKDLSNLNWKPGKILDIGCGNCRNLLPFAKKNFQCYGIDFSSKMLEQAKKYCKKHNIKVNLKLANATKLPFNNNSFNYCLFLAVLHHIKNKKKAIQELYRVLKPQGQALITVWNKLQFKFLFKKKETYIKWGKQKRYYYLFNYFELKRLLKKSNFKILKSNLLGKNLKFLIKKC